MSEKPRHRAVRAVNDWTPDADQDAVLMKLERLARPRAEWSAARVPEAAARRAEIHAEIARLHDVARDLDVPLAAIADAVGVDRRHLHGLVRRARGTTQ